jgi:hypothetical protein
MRDRRVWPWAWWVDALLLLAVAGGLAWSVAAGDRESAAWLAMGAWVLLLSLVVPWTAPETPAWVLALIAVGCGASAVGFFRLYQWAGWPVMAYLDAISTGAYSLLAALVLGVKWSRPDPRPGGAEGRGESPAVRAD